MSPRQQYLGRIVTHGINLKLGLLRANRERWTERGRQRGGEWGEKKSGRRAQTYRPPNHPHETPSSSPPPFCFAPAPFCFAPAKICFAPVVPLRPRRNSALPPSFCLAPNGGTAHSRHENHDFRVDCELCRHWGLSRRTGAKQNCAGA
ncbi:hypothetical protein Bbelb_329220 [Branchiostoma belcheri]|nr:hypothetical protein Bbelb_329220 [Branchiostoma belcheri]